MKFYVGITNNEWFRYLAAKAPEEVNFWRPRSQQQFRAIKKDDLFLFKLHSPDNYIAGGGFYLRHDFLPLWFAWDTFGQNNGVPDYQTFEHRILEHRDAAELTLKLGCTVLVEPFFWPRELWIPVPSSWGSGIMTGKTYDADSLEGGVIWKEVMIRLRARTTDMIAEPAQVRYGPAQMMQPRLGQGAFRLEVASAYNKRCAITGEKTLPALEAAHIRPYGKNGPHLVSNGMLLRSDLHNLFDQGYLTVTLDHKVEISRKIKEEFENGRHYYALHGQQLVVVPTAAADRPAKDYLEWHHDHRFRS